MGLGVGGLGVCILGVGTLGTEVFCTCCCVIGEVIVCTFFPLSCFSILEMVDCIVAICEAMELMVFVIVLMPSIISGEACALHVCWIVV